MKAVIVTGTSSGLGKSLIDLLQHQPVDLFCIARRFLPEQNELVEVSNRNIRLFQADLRDHSQLPRIEDFHHFLDRSEIDEIILIHNAAVVEPIGAVGQLDEQEITVALSVNLIAPILLTNTLLALPKVQEAKLTVVNVSSGAAKRPKDGWAVYCATKAGTEMFFDSFAMQYENDPRVSIHNFDPGIMDTSMQATIRSKTDVHFPQLERFINFKLDGQLTLPDEVAQQIITQFVTK